LTAVEIAWLREIDPDAFSEVNERIFDPASKSVIVRSSSRFRDLVLYEKEEPAPADEQTAAALAQGIIDLKLSLKSWDNAVDKLISRLNFVHQAFPEMGIPSFDPDEDFPFLLEQLCVGSRRYREVQDKPILPVLRQWCTPEQWAAVDSLAPESFKLPSGRFVPLRYEQGEVILSATIQQLYDLPNHPTLAQGRIPMKVELLAPNRRPVQITRDLPAFWTTSYPSIRKELAGRYPKHEWR
jgi:ATP-dependent helicase HrpB